MDPGNQSLGRLGDKYPLLPDRLTCPLPKLSDLIRQAVVGRKYIIKHMVRARQTAAAREFLISSLVVPRDQSLFSS